MTFDEQLDEIYALLIDSPALTLTSSYHNSAKETIKSLISEMVIGEDEKPELPSLNKNSKKNLRPMYKNQLREEQRRILNE